MEKVRESMAKFDLNELPPMDEDVPAEEVGHEAVVVCEVGPDGANQVHAGADTVLYPVKTPAQPHGPSHSEPRAKDREFATQVALVKWLLPKYVDCCERTHAEECSPDEFRMPTSVSRLFLKPVPESPTPEEVSNPSEMPSACSARISTFSVRAIAEYFGGLRQGEPSRTTTNSGANRDRFYINESHWPQSGNDRPTQRMSTMDEIVPDIVPDTGKRVRRT